VITGELDTVVGYAVIQTTAKRETASTVTRQIFKEEK